MALLLLASLLLLTFLPSTATAQSDDVYWQFSLNQPIAHLRLFDVDLDGLQEFIVATEDGEVTLISSNGLPEWQFQTEEPIYAIGAANIDGEDDTLEIVIANQNRLLLLSVEGRELWQRPLNAFTIPPAHFAASGQEAVQAWRTQYPANPTQIEAMDKEGDGRQEIVLMLQSGQVQLIDGDGFVVWQFERNINPGGDGSPQMAINDVNRDGRDEIVFTTFRRFSQLSILDENGRLLWDRPLALSGKVTALELVDFPNLPGLSIAVGTDRGALTLYNVARQRVWPRTLNVPITTMAVTQLRDGPALLVGTAVGTVTAFDWEGRRLWRTNLDPNASRPIISLAGLEKEADERQPVVSAILGNLPNIEVPKDVMLISANGRILSTRSGVDSAGFTQLSDINDDANLELLLARFANIELAGIGIGANETTSEWRQSVDGVPSSILTLDLDTDGDEELLVGTQTGLVYCIKNSSELCWLQAPGGNITHMAALDTISGFPPNIVVVRRVIVSESGSRERLESVLEVWQPNGAAIWSQNVGDEVTALLVQNINDRTQSEIIVGTDDGEIQVFSSSQAPLWSFRLPNTESEPTVNGRRIQELFVMPNNYTNELELLAVTPQSMHKVNEKQFSKQIWRYGDADIEKVYVLTGDESELTTRIIALMSDGTIRGHHWDGIQLPQWPIRLDDQAIVSLPANDLITEAFQDESANSFIIGTASETVVRFDVQNNQPVLEWELLDFGNVSGFYWGDLDGDSLPDLAIGTNDSNVYIYANSNPKPIFLNQLSLSGRTFTLAGMDKVGNQSDLVAITTNGEVELFKAQENRPPLLTNPTVAPFGSGYEFTVDVQDVENDVVTVELEVLDEQEGVWRSQGMRTSNGNPAIWTAVSLPDSDQIQYRFRYNDGIYSGTLVPTPKAREVIPPSIANTYPYIGLTVGIGSLFLLFVFLRQSQLPDAKAARFYRRIRRNPSQTLRYIEERYMQVRGSEDFLLNLARQGRQNQDERLANLADGLYLLPERPLAGLAIINAAIEQAKEQQSSWLDLNRWAGIYRTTYAMLNAPSITELALLRPQLVQLLHELESSSRWSPTLDALLPLLTHIRDSQRVDMPDDQLLYLNEAAYHLRELQFNLPEFSERIEKTLTAVIIRRWSGLLTAEIQELRGRAELNLTLKTRRLVPDDQLYIVLNLENNGRANAELVEVRLLPDPAYEIINDIQNIPILPSGRAKEIQFEIRPLVNDRFRIAVKATFADQIQSSRETVFGDMVHLLPPIREFTPVSNPYLPGTPLRPNSNIFFGRDQLFNFIADNAAGWIQRNVLILIGQRRTGKTSTLLRLGERLPESLLPVYIDCQSLGIIPGMPALFHELAWLISDTLISRDIKMDVPEIEAWESDPRGMFQRQFMPKVRSLLPAGTMILLVFDEFEAFENLVNDGILPPTFFTYLRHLMQHSEGLSFLFVGTRRLEEMSADYWSILFNIALYERIHYLSNRSSMRLITEPVAPHLIYDDLALDKIWRVTAGHPYFLQLVCYTLVKQANENQNAYITISDVNSGLDEMLNLGEVHFAYIWQRSTFVEKAMLTAVAHLMSDTVVFYPDDLIHFLQPYNIHLTPAEVTAALTSLVERDIFQEISPNTSTQYELRVGLVGLWVAKHKSLSKLQADRSDEDKLRLKDRQAGEKISGD